MADNRPSSPDAAMNGHGSPEAADRPKRHVVDPELAHGYKTHQAVIKGLLAAGELSILDIIDHPAVANMRVPDLIYAAANTPGGHRRADRADRVVEQLNLPEHDLVSEMTPWHRNMLPKFLKDNGFRMPDCERIDDE